MTPNDCQLGIQIICCLKQRKILIVEYVALIVYVYNKNIKDIIYVCTVSFCDKWCASRIVLLLYFYYIVLFVQLRSKIFQSHTFIKTTDLLYFYSVINILEYMFLSEFFSIKRALTKLKVLCKK